MAGDTEFTARGQGTPTPGASAHTPMATGHVLSVYPILPVNAHTFLYAAWSAMTSVAGISTGGVSFTVPLGYTAVLRRASHIITPAITGYPASPTTAGKGIIVNVTLNVSALPDLTNMVLMQTEIDRPVYGLFPALSNMGYTVSINEDVAGQFGSSYLWVQLSGELIATRNGPLNTQIAS